MIGHWLGHYRIVAMLGSGGMGVVYRAHDERLDRDVALKVLPAETFGDSTARARLAREARAAAALNHPAICTVHDVGEIDGQPYIAMELVEGRPLSEVTRAGALPLDRVLAHGVQVAEGLAHAHARGVVHRDLKSANIVVASDGRAKILDFGLAKRTVVVDATSDTTRRVPDVSVAADGALVGTIAYMSPEQLRGAAADARSDLWALGVTIYEMATGARPFPGDSTFEISSNILNGTPPPLPPSVPAALGAVIERLLEKDPARRYQTANDVCAALQQVQGGQTALRAMRYWLKRRRWLAAAAAAGIAAAVLALAAVRFVPRLRTPARVESLAVLPMANLSGDPAQDYFADGMTEVLSTDLGRLGGFKRVTARGSVVRYKGTSKSPQEIARELKVDALVTGSILRSGDRVSITAQLVDAGTGDQLWTNRYERSLRDVLALRNEIVSAIVGEIRIKLSRDEAARLARVVPVNSEAFEAYLQGRFHWFKQTREDFDRAERYFQLALTKDPDYALAYAGLASVWMMRADAGFQPASETTPKADAYIAKAFALDDTIADLHVGLANHLVTSRWDWAGAEREFRRAIDINPNLADAHFFYADLLLAQNRREEWDREMRRALDLDPLNDFNWTYYGWHLNYLGRYDEAIPIFTRLVPIGPNRSANFLGLWGAYYRKGLYTEALTAAKEYFAAAGDGEFAAALEGDGTAAAYRAAMKRVGDAMAARSGQRHIPAIRIARAFAHAGDADSALGWLERAYANHESPLGRLAVVWDWVELRPDPRFKDLLRRLKLPQ